MIRHHGVSNCSHVECGVAESNSQPCYDTDPISAGLDYTRHCANNRVPNFADESDHTSHDQLKAALPISGELECMSRQTGWPMV
jgi:hypothetical protein